MRKGLCWKTAQELSRQCSGLIKGRNPGFAGSVCQDRFAYSARLWSGQRWPRRIDLNCRTVSEGEN